jgi:FixJ family two-component response regulator
MLRPRGDAQTGTGAVHPTLPGTRRIAAMRRTLSATVISIVDDDPWAREGTVDLINSLGYATRAYKSAEKFLDSGQVQNTSCLITDLHLPGLNGIELQRQLQDDGYRTPVIFVTAFTEAKVRERALSAGAIAFLAKPFDESALISSLQTALNPK